jgi:hypothetical protein
MTQVGVDTLDGVDLHGKWPRGGEVPHGDAMTFEHYMNEVPLVDHKIGVTWRQRLKGLREITDSLGRGKDFLLMNNEFGLGKTGTYKGKWSRFQKSLALIEFNLELHIAGFDVACMWDNGDGSRDPSGRRVCSNCGSGNVSDHFLTSSFGSSGALLPLSEMRFNPVHYGMELLAHAQNQSMLEVSSNGYRLHGFATRNEITGAIQLFLINKYDGAPQKVRLTLPTNRTTGIRGRNNSAAGNNVSRLSSVQTLVDDAPLSVPLSERWGRLLDPQPLACVDAVCELVLPPLSFSRLS